MNLTDWFDGSVKPARPGVYQREYFGTLEFSKWTGTEWLFGRRTPLEAKSIDAAASRYQSVPWRGFCKPSESFGQ